MEFFWHSIIEAIDKISGSDNDLASCFYPDMINKTKTFLTEDVWRVRREDLSSSKSIGLKTLRIILHAFKGFNEDRCTLSASALTFFTLLSIVPLFAMAFGIAQGFGLEKLLEEQITTQIQGQDEVITYIMDFSNKMLEQTSGGLIAGIGVGVLFFTVIRLLGNIEMSLNGVWGVVEHRSWVRKFSDYLAIMVVCPVLMIVASSMNVYVIAQIRQVAEDVQLIGFLQPLIFFMLKFSPFIVLWLLFSFIYIVIPNTKVSILAGFVGGVAGGTIFQFFQLVYINIMSGMMSNSAVYGSFAALPLFLIWLQISWLIMLFGAQVSFAFQNVDTYELEPDCLKASEMFKKLTALRITNLVVKSFTSGVAPVSEGDLLKEIEIPMRLTKELLHRLVECGVLLEVKSDSSKEISYVPAKDTEQLTVGYVVNALDSEGLMDIPIKESDEIVSLKETLRSFQKKLEEQPMTAQLKSI